MESADRGPSPREDVVSRGPEEENPLTAPLHTLVSLAGRDLALDHHSSPHDMSRHYVNHVLFAFAQ